MTQPQGFTCHEKEDKWPSSVGWPPPLEINIALFPSELIPIRSLAIKVTTDDLPMLQERNILTPFRLTKIEYFMGEPIFAYYEHVKIMIEK